MRILILSLLAAGVAIGGAHPLSTAAQTAAAGSPAVAPSAVATSDRNRPAPSAAVTTEAVLKNYGRLVHANYEDSLAGARQLYAAVQAFTSQPSAERLTRAREAWLGAREFYGQTEAFRFYGGPIDDDQGPEGQINAWPLDESYVDSVRDRVDAGLINNAKFVITKDNLAAQNERGGEENVATGWHAIEFLLWGQDFSDNGPGTRNFGDFVDGETANAARRRQYLQVATELLLDDLQGLVDAWAPEANNYRTRFEIGGIESLRKIFVGLGSLSRGELAGERLEVALASQDQEDEHSCFSDNTHRDAVANALGIQNVFLGRYLRADGSRIEGPAVHDLVAAKDAALAERTATQIATSVAATKAIQAPFDQEIIGGRSDSGRQRIQRAIDSLTQQSKDLVQAAGAIGITKLTLVEPE